jgi:hypothetical protein
VGAESAEQSSAIGDRVRLRHWHVGSGIREFAIGGGRAAGSIHNAGLSSTPVASTTTGWMSKQSHNKMQRPRNLRT